MYIRRYTYMYETINLLAENENKTFMKATHMKYVSVIKCLKRLNSLVFGNK
jgi:hypothetical protein